MDSSKIKKIQFEDLYLYLTMKFQYLTEKLSSSSSQAQQKPSQLNCFSYSNLLHTQNKKQNLSVFDLFVQKEEESIVDLLQKFKQNQNQEAKHLQISPQILKFIEYLQKNFPSIFNLDFIDNLQQKIKIYEDTILQSITKGIFSDILQSNYDNPYAYCLQGQQTIFFSCIVAKNFKQINWFTQKVQLKTLLKQKTCEFLQTYIGKKQSNQNQYQKVQESLINSIEKNWKNLLKILLSYNYLPLSMYQDLFQIQEQLSESSHNINLNNPELITFSNILNENYKILLKKYKQFIHNLFNKQQIQRFSFYSKDQLSSYFKNLFDLHNFKDFLERSYQFQQDQNLQIKNAKVFQTDFNIINLYNIVAVNRISENQEFYRDHQKNYYVNFNTLLLHLFYVRPYETSVFVLYELLSKSNITNINKFFIPLKRNTNVQSELIDPLHFLLIDKSIINRGNSQIFSLSLWIILEAWLQNCQKVFKNHSQNNVNYSKFSDYSTTNNLDKFPKHVSMNDGNSSPKKAPSLLDPRKIFTINKQSYMIGQSSSNFLVQQNQTKRQHIGSKVLSSQKEYEENYKRPLMYNIILFLLTLDVQTTILKYYPIQNDLIKQMIQCDIFPTFLVHNKYVFTPKQKLRKLQTKISHSTSRNSTQTHDILTEIQSAQTLQDLQRLQSLINGNKAAQNNQPNRNKMDIQTQEDFSYLQVQAYPLPWMFLIQSRQILLQMINKPCGYNLISKIIHRHPYTFQKLYESIFPKLIFTQIQQNYNKYQASINKNKSINTYKIQGNKNVKCKKTLDYSRAGKSTQSSINNSRQNDSVVTNSYLLEQKLNGMKQILQFYKKYSKEQIIRKVCQKFLNSI